MNLPSDGNGMCGGLPGANPSVAPEAAAAFLAPENKIAPFEFRMLSREDTCDMGALLELRDQRPAGQRSGIPSSAVPGPGCRSAHGLAGPSSNFALREAALRGAVDAARQEGFQQGEREGRRATRTELEAEMQAAVLRERQGLVNAVSQFQRSRERYFAEVEQEVVKLALAIAGRVLHREAQIDPLLLAGVVRVALEKMADRSGVVLRVAGPEVDAWVQLFHPTEESERPRVVEDAQLARGECVLETRMGTVELGIGVQLEEIEKGFFDLLNHRPVE
jgi:flagellar assembly protein FliH